MYSFWGGGEGKEVGLMKWNKKDLASAVVDHMTRAKCHRSHRYIRVKSGKNQVKWLKRALPVGGGSYYLVTPAGPFCCNQFDC